MLAQEPGTKWAAGAGNLSPSGGQEGQETHKHTTKIRICLRALHHVLPGKAAGCGPAVRGGGGLRLQGGLKAPQLLHPLQHPMGWLRGHRCRLSPEPRGCPELPVPLMVPLPAPPSANWGRGEGAH